MRIIGVGNTLRRDDGVGIAVVEVLRTRCGDAALPGCEFLTSDGEIAGLVETLSRTSEVIFIDAVHAPDARRAGQLLWFDRALNGLDGATNASSHGLGVVEAVRLAAALGHRPDHLSVCGVVGRDFSHGMGLSPPVALAADALCESLWGHICSPDLAGNPDAPGPPGTVATANPSSRGRP